MRRAEDDVLAYKSFPREHWVKIHSTSPLERLNKDIKRRTNVVRIFPNEAAVTLLVGALVLEQNDEWAITRRYMTLETVAAVKLRPSHGRRTKLHHSLGHYHEHSIPRRLLGSAGDFTYWLQDIAIRFYLGTGLG